MIEKGNYLYWLQADNPNLDLEIVWRELYARIGMIFHIIQMNEYNIANIIALEEYEKENGKELANQDICQIKDNIDKKFEKLSKMTFGQLEKEVEKSNYLSEIDMDKLSKIVNYRNYLAHRCFKEKLLKNELSTIEETDKLNDFEVVIHDFNEWLLKIFRKYKIRQVWLKQ